jgi:hypothetical protein
MTRRFARLVCCNAGTRMKIELILLLLVGIALQSANAQGVLRYFNGAAPTHIGSVDGPLAGTNIYAQMFAGSQPYDLRPVGPVDFHINGIVSAENVTVPGVPAYALAYAQLVAWDGTLWGTILSGVPPDQIGRTDIVTVLLTTGVFPDPTYAPPFTQRAIVPIPEPSMWAMGVLAGGFALLRCFACRQLRHPK